MDGRIRLRVRLDLDDALLLSDARRVLTETRDVVEADAVDVLVVDERAGSSSPAWTPRKVIVIVITDRPDHAREALARGARAVLTAADVGVLLDPAISATAAGLVTLSPNFTGALERPALTPREKQVLALVVMGFTNAEIASQLVVAESTVKSHLFSAFKRLGVRTRTEAVALISDPASGLGHGILSISHEA